MPTEYSGKEAQSSGTPRSDTTNGERGIYTIVFDGGSRGNPGDGYGSYLITNPTGREVHKKLDYSRAFPNMTNNQAEYQTLIEALTHLKDLLGDRAGSAKVRVEGDSQLVLNQLRGSWKVRHAGLRPLHAQASEVCSSFGEIDYQWHPRERSVRILGH